MNKDIDGLDWLREVRRKMAADCHYEPKMMGDYYRRIQKQYLSGTHLREQLEQSPLGSRTSQKIDKELKALHNEWGTP